MKREDGLEEIRQIVESDIGDVKVHFLIDPKEAALDTVAVEPRYEWRGKRSNRKKYPAIIPELILPSEYEGGPIKKIKTLVSQNRGKVRGCGLYVRLPICNLVVPDGIEQIDAFAFSDWETLQGVRWPSTCPEIHHSTFLGCSSLKEVTNIAHITDIGEWAFAHCFALNRFVWPNGCDVVPEYCFNNCYALESIDFCRCEKALTIEEYALTGTKLSSVDLSRCSWANCSTKAFNKGVNIIKPFHWYTFDEKEE